MSENVKKLSCFFLGSVLFSALGCQESDDKIQVTVWHQMLPGERAVLHEQIALFEKQHPDIRGDLTDCLIGRLDKDFTTLFNAVGELAVLPPSLPYGGPSLGS